MDTGTQIKALASSVGATEATVIEWEFRGMKPRNLRIRKSVTDFISSTEMLS
jgi:hypothetical protein